MSLTYKCKLCSLPVTSLLIPRESALVDVSAQMQKHLVEKHKESFENVLKMLPGMQALTAALAIQNHFIEFEPDDMQSIEEYEMNCEQLSKLMGFPKESDEDPDEEDLEDDSKGKIILMQPKAN